MWLTREAKVFVPIFVYLLSGSHLLPSIHNTHVKAMLPYVISTNSMLEHLHSPAPCSPRVGPRSRNLRKHFVKAC